jgi:hypothetical protein
MALDEDTGTVYLVTSTVGPTLILSFIFEIFRSYARPGEGIVGGLLVLIALWLLFRAQKRGWAKKQLWWGSILLVVGAVLAVASWQYDAVQLALSPTDFHLTIWR